jgi:hypothetical protein
VEVHLAADPFRVFAEVFPLCFVVYLVFEVLEESLDDEFVASPTVPSECGIQVHVNAEDPRIFGGSSLRQILEKGRVYDLHDEFNLCVCRLEEVPSQHLPAP